ncbi:MAG: 3-isopropylmalate dehydratase small subunit [Thermaerobacter sp.]|nr:3-isopropylmalate dehydratase small subunit [Thermaerobacter sp.]
MTPFTVHSGLVAPLKRNNVDTDQIIPKQFLKRIERTGFGQFLFYDWRFDADGNPNSDFLLNQPPYDRATILLAGNNFGCGSSREHAPWALSDFGFRAIIAPSFADIFYNNCFQNGILPVTLPESQVNELFTYAENTPEFKLTINLQDQIISPVDSAFVIRFDIDPERRERLLKGLDPIGETLLWEDRIVEFEKHHRAATVPAGL